MRKIFMYGQKLAHHNMNTQHPFFTSDNNGFNLRSLNDYYCREISGLDDDEAFYPKYDYFRFVDNNTIIFEDTMTGAYPSWTQLVKIKYENGVWSHAQATCSVNDDNVIPSHDPEPYITSTDPDWNNL